MHKGPLFSSGSSESNFTLLWCHLLTSCYKIRWKADSTKGKDLKSSFILVFAANIKFRTFQVPRERQLKGNVRVYLGGWFIICLL